MAKTKNKPKPKTPAKTDVAKKRQLKQSYYKSFRPRKRIKPDATKKIDSSFKILRQSLGLLKRNWRLYLTITAIYGVLSVILVKGVGGGIDLSGIKESLKGGLGGHYSQLATGTILFSYLLGSAGSSSTPTGGAYQTILIILMSLVVIWSLRQVLAGHTIRARDAFYNGTYPLVQFVLVLLVVSLQLIPLIIGAWIYSVVISNGIATTDLERFIWLILLCLLALLSLYMISSSVFALYIVTLPDMTPVKALRSARALVKHRRWTVLRKVVFLPLAILVIGAVIMIPLILLLTPIAVWVFFGLTMFSLVVVHAYMYSLYRELL